MDNAKKDKTLTLRVTSEEWNKVRDLVEKVKLKEKRADASEVYRELFGLNAHELTTNSDRLSLHGATPQTMTNETVCCQDHAEEHKMLTHILHDGSPRGEWIRGNLVTFYQRSLSDGPAPTEEQQIPRPTGPIKRIPRKVG